MPRPSIRAIQPLVLLAACALLGVVDSALAQGRTLQAELGGEAVLLTASPGRLHVALPDGESVRLHEPEGSEVSSLAALAGGWAAAGTFAAEGGRRELFVALGEGREVRWPAPPAPQEHRLRHGAVLLAEAGELVGMAWLEGGDRRSFSVRAAGFSDGRWGPVERVAAPGPGSQLALTGAVLPDGSWLLAWSGFDGADDEVFWSLRQGETWLEPRRLDRQGDNAVPDITPALTATPEGALAAWSRYDGNDYRVMTARFEDGAWSAPVWLGEAGSLFPSFSGNPRSPRLLYRTVRPNGWTLLELSPAGAVVRRGAVAEEAAEQPAVVREGETTRLVWSGTEASRAGATVLWEADASEAELQEEEDR